jgi:microcystin degradation protein MlrC
MRGLDTLRDIPICGVLDLHANFTDAMAEYADALIAYRHNPHTDAKEAAQRAAALLDEMMQSGKRPATEWKHSRVMWAPTATGTAEEPMSSLEAKAREIEQVTPGIFAVNVFAGFAFADVPNAGVSVSAVTFGAPKAARDAVEELVQQVRVSRQCGNRRDMPLKEAMEALRNHQKGPVLLVEPSDNIGAGTSGRGVSILKAFLENGIGNAAVVIQAPEAVSDLEGLKPGDTVQLTLGEQWGEGPVHLEGELASKSDGQFNLEDPHSHLASMVDGPIQMGPCAVVRCRDILILLTTYKTPPFDLGQLRSQGIIPERLFAIGVKAAVAHRRAYDPIAAGSYTVDTPGPCRSDLSALPYRHVRRPVYPLDQNL